jgi:hypothetical protein
MSGYDGQGAKKKRGTERGRQGKSGSYVVDGAKLKCPFGDKECKLKVPDTRTVFINDKRQANITDFIPQVNIDSFGDCSSLANPTVAAATAANNGKLQKMKCFPAIIMNWMQGKNDVLIGNCPALLKKSYVMCMWGGKINIQDDGQGK